MRVMKYTDRGLILPVETSVAGKYKIQVYRPDGRCRCDTGWFDNLVTDAGLNLMGTGDYLDACQVGSGSATPAVTDTSLGSFVAGTTSIQESVLAAQATAPYYGSSTRRFRFAAGDAAGNLSEVGIGTAATSGTLFSRALITDGAGNPTTITVLADEFLDVTYQIQSVPPTTDSTFNITDSGPAGTVHAVTLRAANVTSDNSTNGWTTGGGDVQQGSWPAVYSGAIGAITGSPSGTSDSVNQDGSQSYANNSLERVTQFTFGLNDGNVGGVASLRVPWKDLGGSWQMGFDPVIPKTNTETLTFTQKVSWTRTTAL